MKGKVQTVLGLQDPDQLGLTLTHEHLLHDILPSVFEFPFPKCITHLNKNETLSLENRGWFQQFPYCFEENKIYNDESVRSSVMDEMRFFKKYGGGTIVDNGCIGIRAKDQTEFLQAVAKETGVHIITGTGYYVTSSQSSSTLELSMEKMVEQMKIDLLEGINNTHIKCGVIGEIGCSWPITDFEKRSLRASAKVQAETGCPVIIHPGRHNLAPEEIIRIFQEAGGEVEHTAMSHLERTLLTKEELAEFASCGVYNEFDLFGVEVSHYQPNEDIDMPSDGQRIERLRHLVQEGYGDKIIIAHDIHTKHRLMNFGGHGFSHIIINIVPKMLKRGFTEDDIKKILYTNPQTWLTFH